MQIVHIQKKSQKVKIVLRHTLSACSERKEFTPGGCKFFPVREVTILKRDGIYVTEVSIGCAFLLQRSDYAAARPLSSTEKLHEAQRIEYKKLRICSVKGRNRYHSRMALRKVILFDLILYVPSTIFQL